MHIPVFLARESRQRCWERRATKTNKRKGNGLQCFLLTNVSRQRNAPFVIKAVLGRNHLTLFIIGAGLFSENVPFQQHTFVSKFVLTDFMNIEYSFNTADMKVKKVIFVSKSVFCSPVLILFLAFFHPSLCPAMTCLSTAVVGSWSRPPASTMNMEKWLWMTTAATTTARRNLMLR